MAFSALLPHLECTDIFRSLLLLLLNNRSNTSQPKWTTIWKCSSVQINLHQTDNWSWKMEITVFPTRSSLYKNKITPPTRYFVVQVDNKNNNLRSSNGEFAGCDRLRFALNSLNVTVTSLSSGLESIPDHDHRHCATAELSPFATPIYLFGAVSKLLGWPILDDSGAFVLSGHTYSCGGL